MTQRDRILAYIRSHPGCTTMELQLNVHPFISNPRARISDLRAEGIPVVCAKRKDGRDGYTLAPGDMTLGLAS